MKRFTRMGRRKDFQHLLDEAVALGATLDEDKVAQTLKLTWDGQLLIRAICKGHGTWIVSYNADFYQPEPLIKG